MKTLSMRDAFFDRLYELARRDSRILVVSADMGAPSLDKFRRDLPSQFVNVGIAENHMVALAAGLALSGLKVFTYAIMPFATARPFEMIKVDFSLMDLPVTTVGVGAGFSYHDSGPTHHATEDVSFMRVLPRMTIFNTSDSVMAGALAEMACETSGPSYVRLDREILPPLYPPQTDFSPGLAVLKEGGDLYLLATGNMVHRALEAAGRLAAWGIDAGVIDLYRLKPVPAGLLLQALGTVQGVITLEEHLLAGGLGSIVAELLADHGSALPLKRIGIPEGYYYAYGGRENIQRLCGLDCASILKTVLEWKRTCGGASRKICRCRPESGGEMRHA